MPALYTFSLKQGTMLQGTRGRVLLLTGNLALGCMHQAADRIHRLLGSSGDWRMTKVVRRW
jgi:hypothetical protein